MHPDERVQTPDIRHRSMRVYPDPVLRRRCAPVDRFGTGLADLANVMAEVMKANGGIGLAAPQIGIGLRLIVVDIGSGPFWLVNPRVNSRSGQATGTEGCLSIPGFFTDIRRSEALSVRARTLRGAAFDSESRGLLARVIQHEIDHLNGVLICDLAVPAGAAGPVLPDRSALEE